MSEDSEFIVEDFDTPTPREQKAHRDELVQATEVLRARREAYGRVFGEGTCAQDDVQLVMRDLSYFCCAFRSTFSEDARVSANLDGRREVFLRICDFTQLDIETLFRKYNQGR